MERMAEIVYVRDANGNLVQTTIKDLRDDRLEQLEEENKKLKEENEELKEAMKELNNYNKFRIQENEQLKEKLNNAGLEEYGFFNEH